MIKPGCCRELLPYGGPHCRSTMKRHVFTGAAGTRLYAHIVPDGWNQITSDHAQQVKTGKDKNVKTVTAALGSRILRHVFTGAAGTRLNAHIVPAGWNQITSDHAQQVAARKEENVKTVTAALGSRIGRHVLTRAAGTRLNAHIIPARWNQITSDHAQQVMAGKDRKAHV